MREGVRRRHHLPRLRRHALPAVLLVLCALAGAPVPAQAPATITPLADVNLDANADRVPDRAGQAVLIRATVLADPFPAQPPPLFRTYVDDGTAGLMLQSEVASHFANIQASDVIEVAGEIGFYNGSTIVSPQRVRVVGAADIPAPIDVTVADLLSERYEGRLIRVRGRLVNAQNVELVDGTGAVRVRARRALLEDDDFRARLYSGGVAQIVGIASQYDASLPYDAGYRIEMLDTGGLTIRIDYRPWIWGLGVAMLIATLWWRARRATQREAYARSLLEKVRTSEQALKDSEARMRVVAEATSDVIWELDLQLNELTWHAGAQELFQHRRDAPVPNRSTHLEFVHVEDAERVERSLRRAIADGRETWEADYRIVRKDGKVCHVSDRARILEDDAGNIQRVIGAIVDVTDRHLADERERSMRAKMQHTQRLESLGILSSGIAHDFNNILAAIVGSAEILRESTSLTQTERTLLDEIVRACELGEDLTGRMLTYAGRAPTERKDVDLNALVTDVSGILRKVVSKTVQLELELDTGSPHVEGDPGQLQQVAMNFITNAVESLHQGRGKVRVTTRLGVVRKVGGMAVAGEFRPGHYVTLQVTDDGAGISKAQQEQIFEPFFTTKASGRGLGLSAVVGILKAHGGCLFLDSRPGRGTTFTALLPVGRQAVEPRPEAGAHDAVGGRVGRVLVADDETFIGQLVAKALEPLAETIEVVTDGNSALSRLLGASSAYDLVVLDVSMPGLNGDEVFARAREAGVTTPVLFISGHGAHDIAARIGVSDDVDILAKPFRLETLRGRCAALVARRATAA